MEKYRPYRSAAEVLADQGQHGPGLWDRETGAYVEVDAADLEYSQDRTPLLVHLRNYGSESIAGAGFLLGHYKWEDGAPCGVEADEIVRGERTAEYRNRRNNTMTGEEKAREIIHKHYNCLDEKYPCCKASYCVMCGGHNTAYDCCECGADDLYEGILIGAELGYKEAVARAKEWLEVKAGNYLGLIHEAELTASTFRTAQLIADFETDMLKLWEEKK